MDIQWVCRCSLGRREQGGYWCGWLARMRIGYGRCQRVPRTHSGEFVISYPRTQIFFGQNMKIHVYLGPVLQGMCWFFCCFTTEKKFQSWGVRAERSREGLRSAHLLGSCASGMAGGKILTHLPKTTGHAPSGHKTEWPPNSASFSLGSASKVTWWILRLLSTHILEQQGASRVPHWS